MQSEAMNLLEKESELEEIVRLVGIDSLSGQDRLVLLTAKMIREDFLHQNAYHDIDTYSTIEKQYKMIKTIINFYNQAQYYLKMGADIEALENVEVREKIARMKYIPNDDTSKIDELEKEIDNEFNSLIKQ